MTINNEMEIFINILISIRRACVALAKELTKIMLASVCLVGVVIGVIELPSFAVALGVVAAAVALCVVVVHFYPENKAP